MIVNVDEEQEQPVLKVFQGGRPPGESNWLSSMEAGTMFLWSTYDSRADPDRKIHRFQVAGKTNLGYIHLINEQQNEIWVSPTAWCSNKELLEILGVFK